jgi:hypothetical protein
MAKNGKMLAGFAVATRTERMRAIEEALEDARKTQ